MKIVIGALTAHTPDRRTVAVEYDDNIRDRSRIRLKTGTYAGALLDDLFLTHQEARALGHALLTDAARAQKELEG